MIDEPQGHHMCPARRDERGVSLFVHAESDAEHYRELDPEAGLPAPP